MSARRPRRTPKRTAGRSRWWRRDVAVRTPTRRPVARARRRRAAALRDTTLIGLDVSRIPLRLERRSWVPLVVAALAGALFLAALRMDVVRMGFAVAENFEQEVHLAETERRLTVRMRQLRDPATLSRRAHELGFRRAEHLIDLPDPDRHRRLPEPLYERPSQPIELAAAADESTTGGRR